MGTSRYLSSRSQYEKAIEVVSHLERKIKAGTATPEETARYHDGIGHVLIYEWAEEEVEYRRQVEAAERARIARTGRQSLPPVLATPEGADSILAPATPLKRRITG